MTNKKENIHVIDSSSAVLDLGGSQTFVNTVDIHEMESLLSSANDDEKTTPVTIDEKYRGYVPWGSDNQKPYSVIQLVEDDEVLSENKLFNALTCYGSGLTYKSRLEGKEVSDEVSKFFKYNRPPKYFLDQCADMKYFFFTVTVIIMDKEGNKIVRIRHKEACHCRFETCNPKNGKIEHLFYGDFEDKMPKLEDLEVIPVLDYYDPIGDLEIRFGRLPDDDGKLRSGNQITKERKFAIINKFPTVGDKYYPTPPSWSIFRSGWYEYSRLIPYKKIRKLKNSSSVKYLVEIHKDYWAGLFEEENITDPKAKVDRKKQQYAEIREFLTGIENANKMWVSGYYTNPHSGKEVSMIKITLVDITKEGGELIEDSAEANNMKCYADAVHSALIGANPGKTAGNFSGSVQRELFTIKQALEKPYHDILLEPLYIVKEFNKWDDVVFDVPVITLTTLDKGKDAEENTLRETNNN
ncbi:hypothetical protein [Dysgonomonas gadei]|uniref:hypothetical protein n=1 Tax=Dysgonomonas gadei TaxID=156974 RepID=UPI003AEF5DF6